MNAKTLDARAEPAGPPAMVETPPPDFGACRSSAADVTIDDFVALISDVTGQLDPANVKCEFAMIAAEFGILAAQIRQAADGITAAVTASGRISREVATALAGIRAAIQHINAPMASLAAPEMTSPGSLRPVPRPSLRN